jgi:hypothetical protein
LEEQPAAEGSEEQPSDDEASSEKMLDLHGNLLPGDQVDDAARGSRVWNDLDGDV